MERNACLIPVLLSFLLLLSCNRESKVTILGGGNVKVMEFCGGDGLAIISAVQAVADEGRQAVDDIKRPVIGEAAVPLEKYIPESPLMNFAADALLEMASRHSSLPVDIAITNKGGLRSNLQQGVVTFGDIYNVFPFENTLAFLTLDGTQLIQLCHEVAAVGGEAVSGLELVITSDGKLLMATVRGEAIDPAKNYRIATSDYLSQGNDRMTTLALGVDKDIKSDITIRELMVQYVKELTLRGEKLRAVCDGRIMVKK